MTNQQKEERRKKVVDMYVNQGMTINAIKKELHAGWDTIKRDLEICGVEIRCNGNLEGKRIKIRDDLFEKIEDHDSAYWLGFLYADGSIRSGDRNEITLELKESDLKTIEDYHSYCKNPNSIRSHVITRNGKEYKSYASSFSSKKVKENLINLGCPPKKSLILTFPTEELVPLAYIYDFVRGYIDGDGYIQYDFDKHRYRIVICGTEAFLKGLTQRLNLFEYISITKDSSSSIYMLTISNKENVFNLLEKFYKDSNYHLERKYQIYELARIKLGVQ